MKNSQGTQDENDHVAASYEQRKTCQTDHDDEKENDDDDDDNAAVSKRRGGWVHMLNRIP